MEVESMSQLPEPSLQSEAQPITRPWLATLPALFAGFLGIWLGIHAFRSMVMMVVWNVAEDLPAVQMGAIAFGVYALGLLAWLPARFLGGQRPTMRFGLLLAGLAVLRQAAPGEVLTPVLAFASCVVWLWWLPAFVQEMRERGALRLLTPLVLLGLAAQSAGQAALHGLDLHVLHGGWSIIAALLLGAAFVGATWWTSGGPSTANGTASGGAVRGALALGPFLFMQLTLLVNPGRVGVMTGWGLPACAALIAAGLLAGLGVLAWRPSRTVRVTLFSAALALFLPAQLPWWAILPLQAVLALALDAAFRTDARGASPTPSRVYVGTAVGALLLFILMFLYYNQYGWTLLWPVATALVLLAGLWAAGTPARWEPLPLLSGTAILLTGLGLSLLPSAGTTALAGPAPAQLKLLDYNIHQGLDTWSVPAAQAIASTIAQADADVISLQEVNRGWNLSGGVDMVAYLRWRFPDYRVLYGPMTGDLYGDIIMSRYPVRAWGVGRYDLQQTDVPRGYLWAKIPTLGGDLLYITTHLAAYTGDAERSTQANALLGFWGERNHTVIAGDFNAHPHDPTVVRLQAAGLKESLTEHGLGEGFTYSAATPHERLDYLFHSPDIRTTAAQIPYATSSDHLPVSTTILLK